jgi:hypothetical protein
VRLVQALLPEQLLALQLELRPGLKRPARVRDPLAQQPWALRPLQMKNLQQTQTMAAALLQR